MSQQINGNSVLRIPQIPNTMCGVRAAVQLSFKAFALIYTSHIIQGTIFSGEKWILAATDLWHPMYP